MPSYVHYTAMKRPDAPPAMEFFERRRPRCGEGEFRLRLAGVGLRLEGLPPELAAALAARFSLYDDERSGADEGLLRVEVRRDDAEYFIDPPSSAEENPVLLACDGDRVRYLGHQVAGWFDTLGGRGLLLLSRGSYEIPDRAVENYVRAATAWQAAERGGALVHGASAVLSGRGYLFFGPSGAGKSTLSACGRRGRVVSDDLSLVLPGRAGGPELVGTPFRGTHEQGEPVVGRFPLAAGFRIVQDDVAAVRTVPRLLVLGQLVGNLPFVAESFGRRPDLFTGIEKTLEGLPLAHLHFRRDDSYWDAILKWHAAIDG